MWRDMSEWEKIKIIPSVTGTAILCAVCGHRRLCQHVFCCNNGKYGMWVIVANFEICMLKGKTNMAGLNLILLLKENMKY